MNKVELIGRLTRDPEIRTNGESTVARYTLAVDRRFTNQNGEREADFINCVAWRTTAEFVSKYFRKGSAMCIVGSLQVRKWVDSQTNQNRSTVEVIVDEAMFVDSKNDSAQSNYASGESYAAPAAAESFDVVKNEDDLPF